jgi:hypothetical protein
MNHQMSLYIPHVFVNITEERMIQAFQKRQIGKVNHIDFVSKFGKGNKIHQSAYLHFDYWYDTKASRDMQSELELGKELKMFYDDPWYWQIYKNETKKFGGNGQRKERLVLEKPAIQEQKTEEPEEIFKEEDFSTTFTQEEIDEIERMILEEQEEQEEEEFQEQEEEFQEQEEEFQECFGWVDARYAELLEAKLALVGGYTSLRHPPKGDGLPLTYGRPPHC